jgi:hypothetical protein
MISKKQITVFWGKKWDAIVSTLRFEIWTPTSLLVYIDNIHCLHLKGQTQILIQNWNWFKIYSHGLYQIELWHGNDGMIFHICKEDRPIIYMHDETTGVYPRTTVFILSF